MVVRELLVISNLSSILVMMAVNHFQYILINVQDAQSFIYEVLSHITNVSKK